MNKWDSKVREGILEMAKNGSSNVLREYAPPVLFYYGKIESVTGGLPFSILSLKEWDGVEDDVTPYGFLGTPMCKD